jgi:hypothetical protein
MMMFPKLIYNESNANASGTGAIGPSTSAPNGSGPTAAILSEFLLCKSKATASLAAQSSALGTLLGANVNPHFFGAYFSNYFLALNQQQSGYLTHPANSVGFAYEKGRLVNKKRPLSAHTKLVTFHKNGNFISIDYLPVLVNSYSFLSLAGQAGLFMRKIMFIFPVSTILY